MLRITHAQAYLVYGWRTCSVAFGLYLSPSFLPTISTPFPSTYETSGPMADSEKIKEAFTKATQLSTQTEETFQKVATLLGKSKKLGPQHDLTIEWDSLRQVRHSSSTTSYYMLIVVCENPNRLGEVLLKKRERMLVESRPSYLVRNP